MTDQTIIDTDILIDVGRNSQPAVDYLERLERRTVLSISAITQMELIVGCRNRIELRQLSHFLRRFQILPLTEAISVCGTELLSHYRLSHGLLIADALIAATAISIDIPLGSKNQRDYRYISELTLLPFPLS